jgi:hypothetical protein
LHQDALATPAGAGTYRRVGSVAHTASLIPLYPVGRRCRASRVGLVREGNRRGWADRA